MRKPEVLEKNPTSMAVLKEELAAIEKRDKELSFRGTRTLDYLNEFVKLDAKKAKELTEKLQNLDMARLKEEFIHKIVDMLPKSVDELKVVLQGYTLSLSNDDMKKVVDIVKEYIPKK